MHLNIPAVLLASTALIGVAYAGPIEENETQKKWLAVEANAPQADEEKALLGVRLSSSERGVVIESTVNGSAADKAGLQAGDIVLKVNGKPATVEGLVGTVQRSTPGTLLKLAVARGDALKHFKVKLGALSRQRRSELAAGPDGSDMVFFFEGDDESTPKHIRAMILKEIKAGNPQERDRPFEAKVVVELNGEDFNPEDIMGMIQVQLAEQLGGEMGEEHIAGIMAHISRGMQSGEHHVVIEVDSDAHRGPHPDRQFMDQRFQAEFEEQLRHLDKRMNERFKEGEHMFGDVIGELHEQFDHAGSQIRDRFERAGEHFGQMRERIGRAFEELQGRQERLMEALEESRDRERQLAKRVERLESAIGELMDQNRSQRDRPRRGRDRDRDRDDR